MTAAASTTRAGDPSEPGKGEILLTTPLLEVPGIGPKAAGALATLGLTNVGRLLAHLPHRHEAEQGEAGIAELQLGEIVSARGTVTATRVSGPYRKQRFEAVVEDGSGRLDLVFFNQAFLAKKIHPGDRVRVQGKLARRGEQLQLANPKIEVMSDGAEPEQREGRLRPVYPASESAGSRVIERAMEGILEPACAQLDDHLSRAQRKRLEMPTLADAYRAMHRPEDESAVNEARRRLAFDELLFLQLAVQMKRAHLRQTLRAPPLRLDDQIDVRIRERFPFELTPAQNRALDDLTGDLTREVPTNRLIQGDVGSGKTAVALYAMLLAVASGHQAVLMAPTELLAEQHDASISRVLEGARVRTALLTGSLAPQEAKLVRDRLAAGKIDIAIGTHALITDKTAFSSLALAVIDEQHRFGVQQRASLRVKGGAAEAGDNHTPHVVVMTATPIPRTVGLTLFGDLDISTIDGMPPGRSPVRTEVVGSAERERAWEAVREAVERGEQAYIVVPAIDGGETGNDKGLRDLRTVMSELERGPLAELKLAALHGRLTRNTRETIMERFRIGKIDALVATTVIEVGVDVPNATVMVIEQGDRFGLAQLHQLRGRVGRGSKPGRCVLIADPVTDEGAARLKAISEVTDGFRLAERDFELRGPGEVLGVRQAGLPPFRVANLLRDVDLLALARREATNWINDAPKLERTEDALAKRRLRKSHGDWIRIADVG